MRSRILNLFLAALISIILSNCANKGTPQGGPEDVDPPVIIKTSPENYALNFKGSEIEIVFNEFITIKNLQKQLIISPPMKNQPIITPLGGASKRIQIKILDTLPPNTTYALNFGNSIEDNNAGNPYTYYRYVFSTGNTIDSLKVSGTIKDILKREPETFVSVMLYEIDSTFTDSIIYKKPPKYITNTLDSVTTFTIENIKEGRYLLMALKDKNGDNTYQQKSDQIAFYNTFINVPTDSLYNLTLFNEVVDFKPSRPLLVNGQKIRIGYEGNVTDVTFSIDTEVPDDYEYRITKDQKNDTLYYWYKPKLELDSILLNIIHPKITKPFTVRIRDKEKDSLVISAQPNSQITYNEDLKISGNIPFTKFDTSKVQIINKDSVPVKFTLKSFDSLNNTYALSFDKTEDNNYKVSILPDAFTDFFENTNDTIQYNLRTLAKDNYGNLRLNIFNAKYPVIVQLTDTKSNIKYEQYATEEAPLDFLNISPGIYFVRVIFDSNGNKMFDSGNYLEKTQPEVVKHSEKALEEVRAGWDQEISFTLRD